MTTAAHEGVGLAAAWRLLSLGFAPPTEETLAEVESLAEGLADLESSAEIADVLEAVRDTELEEAAARYAALFRGGVFVAPYEGSYELDPTRLGRQLSDVAAFYRAFGAEAHGPDPHEGVYQWRPQRASITPMTATPMPAAMLASG